MPKTIGELCHSNYHNNCFDWGEIESQCGFVWCVCHMCVHICVCVCMCKWCVNQKTISSIGPHLAPRLRQYCSPFAAYTRLANSRASGDPLLSILQCDLWGYRCALQHLDSPGLWGFKLRFSCLYGNHLDIFPATQCSFLSFI